MVEVVGWAYNMKQQNNRLITKPAKSLSARTFVVSGRKKSPMPITRRVEIVHTEPIETETHTSTRRHLQLDFKSSRLILNNSKKDAIFFKPAEELSEQNRRLKMRINWLQQELLKEKSRNLQNTKGLQKLHKQFDVQFDNEKHFEAGAKGQANLVQGVKYQYQKIKQKYNEKCREYDALLGRYEISAGEQSKFYCEALEIDNKKLQEKLSYLLKTEEKMFEEFQDEEMREIAERGQIFSDEKWKEEQRQKIAAMLGLSSTLVALENKVENYSRRHTKMKIKISLLRQTINEKTKKIEHLDKLITDKSNECHKALIKQRKLNKQLKNQSDLLQKMKSQLQAQDEKFQHSILMLKQQQHTKFETEKTIFKRALAEKDEEIQKFAHEVQYLSMILSYLKTGDGDLTYQQVQQGQTPQRNAFQENSREMLLDLDKSLTSIEGQKTATIKRVRTQMESTQKQHPANVNTSRVLMQVNTQNLKQIKIISDDEMQGQSEQSSNSNSSNLLESRIIKKSYFKHNPRATKMRHVKSSQIEHLKQELVLRFMYYRLTIDSIKNYFSLHLTKEQEKSLSRREKKWRTHYITMKEVQEKFLGYPFDLKAEEAFLMARYVVEDATKEDVYCQEDNEVQRSIAKSIIKAFVGEYVVPDDEECRVQIKDVLQKSGKNLRSALTSLAPSGYISSIKFLQICAGIQVDFSETTKSWILSQLFAKASQGLSQLEYAHLFEGLC